jgi:hypothetical protein
VSRRAVERLPCLARERFLGDHPSPACKQHEAVEAREHHGPGDAVDCTVRWVELREGCNRNRSSPPLNVAAGNIVALNDLVIVSAFAARGASAAMTPAASPPPRVPTLRILDSNVRRSAAVLRAFRTQSNYNCLLRRADCVRAPAAWVDGRPSGVAASNDAIVGRGRVAIATGSSRGIGRLVSSIPLIERKARFSSPHSQTNPAFSSRGTGRRPGTHFEAGRQAIRRSRILARNSVRFIPRGLALPLPTGLESFFQAR